jgi:valyl-tRNA synthetase
LWWGHRIPIWSKRLEGLDAPLPQAAINRVLGELLPYGGTVSKEDGRIALHEQFQNKIYATFTTGDPSLLLICVDEGHPEIEAQLEKAGCVQDPDVLDTWFSSALWPHATLGWPDVEHDPPLDAEECAKQTALSSIRDALSIRDASARSASNTPGDSPGAKSPSTLEPRTSTNSVLATFYPGSVLITSRDIITLWVARMVLTGLYNMGDVPFRHVHVHPKILDGFGQTMSKSKGNGVDPVDLIDKYGADAVRFTIASFAGETQDVRLPISYECPKCETLIPQTLKHQKAKIEDGKKPTVRCPKCKADYQFTSPNYEADAGVPVARMVSERFEYGRNFCNKFWNAARFAMLNLEDYTPGDVTADQLQLEDRWILSRLSTVTQQVDQYLGRYQFDAATRAIREFTWNEFCDWYLEMIKPRLRKEPRPTGSGPGADAEPLPLPDGRGSEDETRAVAQRVLVAVLDSLVRLLQPFTPFICEELWQRLKEIASIRALPAQESGVRGQDSKDQASSLKPQASEDAAIIAAWPCIPAEWQDEALERRFARLQETIIAVRNVRAIYSIPPGTPVKLLMRASADVAGDMQSVASQFDNLAKAVLEAAGAEVQRPIGAATFSLGETEGFIPLEGLIDRAAELDRQTKEAEKLRKHIAGHEGKLSNESFTAKAPPDVVAQVRETLDGLKRQLASVEAVIRDLA